jgi:hypothetical protein
MTMLYLFLIALLILVVMEGHKWLLKWLASHQRGTLLSQS